MTDLLFDNAPVIAIITVLVILHFAGVNLADVSLADIIGALQDMIMLIGG